MFTVLINELRKAEATATAIVCRGCGAYPDRTYVKNVHFHPAELSFIAQFLILEIALIVWERAV